MPALTLTNLYRPVRGDRAYRRPATTELSRDAPADHALQRDREIDPHPAIHRPGFEPGRITIGDIEIHRTIRRPQVQAGTAPAIAVKLDVERSVRRFAAHVAGDAPE